MQGFVATASSDDDEEVDDRPRLCGVASSELEAESRAAALRAADPTMDYVVAEMRVEVDSRQELNRLMRERRDAIRAAAGPEEPEPMCLFCGVPVIENPHVIQPCGHIVHRSCVSGRWPCARCKGRRVAVVSFDTNNIVDTFIS